MATQIADMITALMNQAKPELATATAALGYNPTSSYQSYIKGWYNNDPSGMTTPPTFDQWVQDTVKSLGSQGIANLIKSQYEMATGQTMSNDLMVQVMNTVAALPSSAQEQIASAITFDLTTPITGTGANRGSVPLLATPGPELEKIVAKIGPLQTLLKGAEAGPTLAQQQADSRKSTFFSALGRMPTDAEMKQMAGMNDIDFSTYLNQQNVTGTHLNYGQYSSGESLASGIWKQYFSGAPSKNDISMMAGMTSAQAHAWAMKQPSYIPGVTVGDSVGIGSAAATISAANWNIPPSPSMIQAIAQHVQGQNPAPNAPPKAY